MAQSTIAIIILVLVSVAFAIPQIPIAVTAILASLSMVVVGILNPPDALSFFGNDIVLMVAGASVIANAIFETGLASKLGIGIMHWKWAVKSEKNFLFVMFVATAALSSVMGNVPVLAIMFPLAAAVASESEGRIRRKTLYMAMAIASGLGGNVTLAGSSMNMLAQGVLQSTEGVEAMGFFTLARGAVPSVLVSLLYFVTVGNTLQEKVFNFNDTNDVQEEEHKKFRKYKAIIAAVCFCLCIAGFIAGVWSIGTTSLVAATICIATGCISFKTAMQKMDWTTVCVLAGALGLAKGVNTSGACTIIAEKALGMLGGSQANPFVVVFAIVLIGALFTNVMQNNAVVAILLPIAISMAKGIGVNYLPFVTAVIYSASFAFATPIGTAPMTMSLAAGYRFSDYIKIGGLCELLAILVTALCIPLFYPF